MTLNVQVANLLHLTLIPLRTHFNRIDIDVSQLIGVLVFSLY